MEFETVIFGLFEDRSSQLNGDVLHLPASHHYTANNKAAGSDATPEAITETEQTYTVSTHKILAVLIEDFAKIQSRYDIRREFNRHAAYGIARAKDTDAAALFDDNTLNVTGVLGSELSYDNWVEAWTLLANYSAPAPFNAVVSPATYAGCLKIDQFVNSGDYGADANAIERAKVGKILETTLYRSNLLSGTAPNSAGAMWSPSHFFKIVQREGEMHALYRPFSTGWEISYDSIYGVFERQEAVETAAGTTATRQWSVYLKSKK